MSANKIEVYDVTIYQSGSSNIRFRDNERVLDLESEIPGLAVHLNAKVISRFTGKTLSVDLIKDLRQALNDEMALLHGKGALKEVEGKWHFSDANLN